MKFSLNKYLFLLAVGSVASFAYFLFNSSSNSPHLSEAKMFSPNVAESAIESVFSTNAEDKKKKESNKPEETEKQPDETKSDELVKTEDDKTSESSDSKEDPKPPAPEEMVETKEAEETEPEPKEELAPEPEPKEELAPEPEPEPPFRLVLPTDNREIFEEPEKFYMHTNRYIDGKNLKPWTGGKYGFVRNKLTTSKLGVIYTKLHEGIDIKPLKRDKYNRPLDDVYTMGDGTVAYVNNSSSRSNYGKYVVVKHEWPCGNFYSLYAHLASTTVHSGKAVKAGDVLGRLGYTGAGIDRERAHVHVELAFMKSERFNTSFSPGNGHRNCNGLNLLGIDVARYLIEHNKNPHMTMREFLDGEEPYYKVRTATKRMPGILKRHPWLGKDMDKAGNAKSWEFTFARSGVPISIAPYVEKSYSYPIVSWVKTVNTNHSYMTASRLLGSGSNAKLSSRGHRFIKLVSEAF